MFSIDWALAPAGLIDAVGKGAFAELSSDQLTDPSVALLKSRFPVVSIWEANLYANDNTISEWKQESALVARPELQVKVRRLSAGGYQFFAALAEGQTVGSAVTRAMASAPAFSLAACFTTLVSANIVIGFELRDRSGLSR